VSKVPCFLWR
jgi:hypothetical protein